MPIAQISREGGQRVKKCQEGVNVESDQEAEDANALIGEGEPMHNHPTVEERNCEIANEKTQKEARDDEIEARRRFMSCRPFHPWS